jgi:hypothetical protein
MKPNRWSPVLLVGPKLARHPTLVGERLAESYEIIGPAQTRPRFDPGAVLLLVCVGCACAAVVTAGLLG